MDPNELLRELRASVERLRNEELDRDDEHELLYAVVEGFDNLDQWLSRGGFPPEAWREGPDAFGEEPVPLGPPNPAGVELPAPPYVTYPSGWIGQRNQSWVDWAQGNPDSVLPRDRDKVPHQPLEDRH